MEDSQKEALLRYEEAKLKIKEYEAVVEELKPTILQLVPDDTNVQTEKGYFFLQRKAKWKYTPQTEAIEKDLKERKKDEEAKGDATAEYSRILVYKEGQPT